MPHTHRLARRALLKRVGMGMALPLLAWAPHSAFSQAKSTASAAEALPTDWVNELPGAKPLGGGRMRFWGLDIYDARLWVVDGFAAATYAQHAFALELNYLRALRGKAIAERSLQEMQRQGAINPAQEKAWLAAMELAFPDVKNGDRIVGAHTPGMGARFWHNGQPRPAVRDADFSRLFFGIWLSGATSEPALRTQLLGLGPP